LQALTVVRYSQTIWLLLVARLAVQVLVAAAALAVCVALLLLAVVHRAQLKHH
jgi:hypothetical protein